ncbi:hypothetical protein BBI15_14065 [Planococcus plakortidis]|uniref:DUF2188 domain-containing protein n=2 Tax=Planococcus TaxID=1372 RepID=A0A1C7EC11_9BACL|nr:MULTISPECIES: DUF2188 domain-containing protein [Planococcus]ANU21231.1 hypothetical protein BBI15_14065 [Planococcus plakortidis]AUD12898.1 DUF2188 domain-containing protein [Planococcus sp. MB-3u-03]PKG47518.1 DUF2188 domain-containing protein [Planococcus sp. Urea-trap-24]PKG88158.1 DUF2188 domain-containing protein [Planococcus sp. Urea-3u-39]PKH36917.1 DUF2188 domain-containing protein [Planococcus sp. MB-3u-09]
MPWNKNDYPDSFKNLDENVRNKAIEIANALLRDGYEEGRAIPIALDQARDTVQGDSEAPVYEIRKHSEGWQLKKKDSKKAILIEETKDDLMDEAKRYVNRNNGELHIYAEDGSLQEKLYD